MFILKFFKDFILKARFNDPSSKNVFDHYFFDLKYYLHKEASKENFAILLNISPEQLEQISKVSYNSSFEVLLNEHRYIHFMNELNSTINSNLSLESILKLCGYENNVEFVDFVKQKQVHEH